MEQWLNELWAKIAPYLGGVTIGGIFTAVIVPLLRSAFTKALNKIDVKKIAEDTTKEAMDKIKGVSFKQSLAPLAKSELAKITETANKYIESTVNQLDAKYETLIDILSKLSAYFDNSIAVSENAKKELHDAIIKATEKPTTEIVGEVVVVDTEEEKTATSENNGSKNTNKVVR